MAILPMTDATVNGIASSAEYNKLIDNIQDLDARLGPVLAANSANLRLTNLESLTTDTATSPGGIGNQRLADRLGTGVGTTTNTTTGTATAQLTSVRTRLTTLESASNFPGAWTTVSTYSNSWGSRTGFPVLSVRTLPGENVQIFGTIYRAAGGMAAGTVVCTLPVGFRPTGSAVVFGMDSSNILTAMEIVSSGNMQIKIPAAATSGNTISIAHIYYVGSGVPNA